MVAVVLSINLTILRIYDIIIYVRKKKQKIFLTNTAGWRSGISSVS